MTKFVIPPDGGPSVEGVFDLTARRTAKALQDEVVTLKERIAELQSKVVPALDHGQSHGGATSKSECRFHLEVIVDESKLTVTCRHCGVDVNPFVVLLEFSKKERLFFNQLTWRLEERKQLRIEIERLKKERKSLRGQVSAAKKRLHALGPEADE